MTLVHPSADVNDVTREHYNDVGRALADWYWYNDRAIGDFVLNIISGASLRILDLCGGPGVLAKYLLSHSEKLNYDLVDISETMCDLAAARLVSYKSASVHCGSWIQPVIKNKYDIVIIKNALHVVDNMDFRLKSIANVLSPGGLVVIIETVSPSEEACQFVREVFHLSGLAFYKHQYFTEHSFKRSVGAAGLTQSKAGLTVDQIMSVDDWLDKKHVSREAKAATLNFIRSKSSCAKIAAEMRIQVESNRVSMLRRQQCCVYEINSQSKDLENLLALPIR